MAREIEQSSGRRRKEDPTFAKRQGGLLLRVAGDIKRNPGFLAAEIGMSTDLVNNVLSGRAPQTAINTVIEGMVDKYPVSRLGLEIVRDDTDEGAIVQSSAEAAKTSRVFKRVNGKGELTDYYEYRDAAMSDLGPFRPEWIRELREVTSTDGNNPDIAYNKGHFLHQLTLYVGSVNLHWKDDNGSHTAFMNTGDSNYGTPYVPHSFTTRDPDKKAYIMAVTFGGKLEGAMQKELSVLSPQGVTETLIDLSAKDTAFSGLLRMKARDSLMTADVIIGLTGFEGKRLDNLFKGKAVPTMQELEVLAGALGVNVRDLYPPDVAAQKQVVIERHDPDKAWEYPTKERPHYLINKLAGSPKVAETKGFMISTNSHSEIKDASELDLSTPMHTFGYNYGDEPTMLYWEGSHHVRQAVVEPGASFYLKPLVGHALRHTDSNPANIMLVRMGGGLSGDSYFELSSLPREQMERLLRETGVWY